MGSHLKFIDYLFKLLNLQFTTQRMKALYIDLEGHPICTIFSEESRQDILTSLPAIKDYSSARITIRDNTMMVSYSPSDIEILCPEGVPGISFLFHLFQSRNFVLMND